MRHTLLITAILSALLFSGCALRAYQDTPSEKYATLQLIPKSKTFIFIDDYYSELYDLKDRCNPEKESFLGALKTDSDSPSRIAKITAEEPLYIVTKYVVSSSSLIHTTFNTMALRPEKNKHYVIEYEKKSASAFRDVSQYQVYMVDNGKKYDVPKNRIKKFDALRDCTNKNYLKF